jgi:4'-phosphopantetheinyl transferase
LTSFAVPLGLDGTRTDVVLGRRWSLYTLQPAPSYIGALVVEGRGRRLRQWDWQASLERSEEMAEDRIEQRVV